MSLLTHPPLSTDLYPYTPTGQGGEEVLPAVRYVRQRRARFLRSVRALRVSDEGAHCLAASSK